MVTWERILQLLTPQAFKSWLETWAPEETIGRAGSPFHSPIAWYLRQRLLLTHPLEWVYVSPRCVIVSYIDDDKGLQRSRFKQPPDWVGKFIQCVDAGKEYEAPVSASEALSYLQECLGGGVMRARRVSSGRRTAGGGPATRRVLKMVRPDGATGGNGKRPDHGRSGRSALSSKAESPRMGGPSLPEPGEVL